MSDSSDAVLRSLRHELRTPINHIVGYSELLLEEAESSGWQAYVPDLERIHAAGRSLLALVDDLLDSQKVAAGGVDAGTLSRDLRTLLNTVIGYGDMLQEQAADSGEAHLTADLAKIRDAGTHLLELVGAVFDLSRLRGGVAPAEAPPNGLSTNGAVTPQMASIGPPVRRVAATPMLPEPVAGGAILVVDDDPTNRDVLSRRLARRGFSVAVAEDGREALEMLATQSYDLLLLDVVMPAMDGFQVLAHLKGHAALRELPVIVLSALDEVDDAVACIEMGADDYLAKPVNTTLLMARIGACLEKKRLRDREVAYLRQAALVTGPAALAQVLCAKYDFGARDVPADSGVNGAASVDTGGTVGAGERAPDQPLLADLAQESEWVALRKGDVLCRRGDPSDGVYVVAYGRLRVLVPDTSGREQPARDLRRGDIVGELGLITGAPRSATVYALRDAGVVRISRAGFHRLAEQHPRELTRTTGDVMSKLRQAFLPPQLGRPVTAIALVPLGAGVSLAAFARDLAASLAAHGPVLHLESTRLAPTVGEETARALEQDPESDRVVARLDELEQQYRFVLYQTDAVFSPWTQRCVRQADRILLLGHAGASPRRTPLEEEIERAEAGRPPTRRELALLYPDRSRPPAGTGEWLAARAVEAHHHLCVQSQTDMERLARRLADRGIGLVLGGGGMRGAAHVGVLRALTEAKVPIDLVGGTSVGALIAAQYAAGWHHETMWARTHALIVQGKALGDYTLPLTSLVAGRRYRDALIEMFGQTRIEDLWLPYFCVSSNLTRADLVVHREGLLWRAVRASSSLPGVLPPVPEQHDLLVDGGLLNNLPADVMSTLCGGPVIAVDLRAKVDLSEEYDVGESVSAGTLLWSRLNPLAAHRVRVPGILDVLVRSSLLGSVYAGAAQLPPHTLYMNPPVAQFGLLDGTATPAMIEIGYRHAQEQIARWQQAGLI